MTSNNRLPLALLLMRVSVFFVMLLWTIDKFVNPDHAARVYEKFYFIPGVGPTAFVIVGIVELIIIVLFLAGIQKRITYGLVFIFHAVSTLSTWKSFLDPFESMLFFTAWPMLAACFTLYYLRDADTMCTVGKKSEAAVA